ncbi:MAG: hypothetical protein U5J63_08195 [Fodinibius sp.]|nr:hypothetical protein [Fodinibius sp.]
MGSVKQFLSSERLRFLAKRLLYAGLICLIYFSLWRPARVTITENLVAPQVTYLDSSGDAFSSGLQTGSLLINYVYADRTKQLQYRPQFGLFFLITLLALLFVSQNRRHYLMLGLLHLGASLLTYLFLIVGATGVTVGFILTDAISGYLTPALSLAIVPLVIRGVLE